MGDQLPPSHDDCSAVQEIAHSCCQETSHKVLDACYVFGAVVEIEGTCSHRTKGGFIQWLVWSCEHPSLLLTCAMTIGCGGSAFDFSWTRQAQSLRWKVR